MNKKQSQIKDIGSIVINFLRPDITIKCIESLKQQTPDINIYVGDQDENGEKLKEYCEKYDINYVKLNFDCGIGVARNTLIEHAKTDGCKYIMWGDNDFVYDERFRLGNALIILDKDKKAGIVGGAVLKNNQVQHYERIIYYDKFYQTACFIPLEYIYPKTYYANNVDYYYCDMTFNFCVARINIFNKNVKWDDEIKVKFEHSFFFCKYLKYSELRVVYCPSMMVNHVHEKDEIYEKYRYRVSDGETYSKNLKMKTGFSINEKSWNHVTQNYMDFRKVASESPTYISALKYNVLPKNQSSELTILEENILNNSELVKPSKKMTIKEEFQFLDAMFKKHNLTYCVIKTSCLDLVRYGELRIEPEDLYLAVNNLELSEKIIKELNLKLQVYITDVYPKQTKEMNFYDISVNIPFPVKSYLAKLYGSGERWRRFEVK